MLVLVALSAVLSALALALFVRRDVGAHVALPAGLRRSDRRMGMPGLPLSAWSLQSVFARSLASLGAAASWGNRAERGDVDLCGDLLCGDRFAI